MAGLKELRRRIKSVSNTKKITYAMKLVSATKLKRAQHAVLNANQYAGAIRQILNQALAGADLDKFHHPLITQTTEVKKVCLVVVGANRGLCGSFNSGINQTIQKFIKSKTGVQVDLKILGKKPVEFAEKRKLKIDWKAVDLMDDPLTWDATGLSVQLANEFVEKKYDEIYVLYTKFKSAISVSPKVERLLPIELPELADPNLTTIFKPDLETIFNELFPQVLSINILQAFLDSKASEHGSRMTAMDSATKNAGELVSTLQLKANKLRQSGITGELLDIIGGAKSLE